LVVRLAALKKAGYSLDDLGWAAWWDGLSVPDRLSRECLGTQAAAYSKDIAELVTDDGELTKKAEDALDASLGQLKQKPLRWIRRRVGLWRRRKDESVEDGFDLFLQLLLMVGAGQTDWLQKEDLQLLDHGLGFDRARTDRVPITGAPWLDSDPRDNFEAISQRIDPTALAKALELASDEELRRTRDKAKVLLSMISSVGRMLQESGDRWSFGMAAHSAFLDDFVSSAKGQAFVTLFLLSCIEADGSEGVDAMVRQAPQVQQGFRDFEAVKALLEAVPEVADAVSLQMIIKSSPEKLAATFAELRKSHGDCIDAFFASNPELLAGRE
jgi:hypothetical protein